MQSIAIKIKVGNATKVVGKLIVMPRNESLPQLEGYYALFREVKWNDLVSRKITNTIGIDAEAWKYCNDNKAGGMVIYCTDQRKFITVKASDINQCRVIDIGEMPQYRIPLSMCKVYNNMPPIKTAWVAKELLLEPKAGWPSDSAEQGSLFGGDG